MRLIKMSIGQPLTFISGGSFTADQPFIHPRRTITSFEIIIGVRDIIYIDQNQTCYELGPRQTLLLLPGEMHGGYAESPANCSFHWLHFLPTSDYELIEERELIADLQRRSQNPYYGGASGYVYIPMHFTPPEIDRINILFHQLLHTMKANYYTKHAMNYLLTMLLIELSEQTLAHYDAASSLEDKGTIGDKKLMKILEWIRIHSAHPITVQQVAEQFTYNKDYLNRYFKRKMGMSVQEYIHKLKMAKAKNMLYQSRLSIKEIAYSLGFQDDKYFMKMFKRHEGLTPTEFRNAYYQTHLNNK